MPNTGGLGFQSVLHNITPEMVAVCYREGDADSLAVAEYYQAAREIPDDNLIALPTTTLSVISESEYLSTIENPLLTALNALGNSFNSQGARAIWVIVLGYNIPHAYLRDDDPYGDPIAIASRLHRLGFPAEYKRSNFTFDRRGAWQFFDTDDVQQVLLTTVLDGPTPDSVRTLIDRAQDVDNQTFITGKVYVDPYGKKTTDDQLDFQSSMLDFIENELPLLGLDSQITVDTSDPYTEPIVSAFNNDSFYWGWFTPRYSRDLFLNQNERRVFLYNADDDAAADIRASLDVDGSDPWCNIAIGIEPGYASCAGAVAPSGEDTYLRPRPFFEALHRGTSLAEAFLYCSPVLEWKIILIGDPLMVVNFPVDLPPDQDLRDNTLPNHEVIRRIKEHFAETLAWGARQSRLSNELVITNYQSSNISEELHLLGSLTTWRDQKNQTAKNNLLAVPLAAWLNYVLKTDNRQLGEWLSFYDERISILLDNALSLIASGTIDDELIYPAGHWDHEFVYTHERFTFEDLHFELELHNNTTFTDLAVGVDGFNDAGGWEYESEPYAFVQIPDDGFPSSLSGRRIKYSSFTSAQYLTTTEIYYARWRALDVSGMAIIDWQESTTEKIITR